MNRVAILAGVRTPFAKMGTSLRELDAADLGRTAVAALLARTGVDPARIDEVILGCVAQPPDAPNLARVVALRSGIPESVPALTVQRNCASGLEAIFEAARRLRMGEGSLYLVGGVESMSQVPFLFPQSAARKFSAVAAAKSPLQKIWALGALRLKDFRPVPGLKLGLTDPVCGLNMGETAEVLAREFSIGREAQDAFALRSHRRAAASDFRNEITPAYDTRHGLAIEEDNGIRSGQSLAALAKLKPIFEEETGTVTAGNSSQITDGAVALFLGTDAVAARLGLTPMGYLTGSAVVGCDPVRMGMGPVFAIQRLLAETGLRLEDADRVEINEAFAVQVLAVLQQLKSLGIGEIPDDRLNVHGGAIALGHPVGATGARLVLTALEELQNQNLNRALVSLCVGGGQGAAAWLERL